jgi:hypothetical protein
VVGGAAQVCDPQDETHGQQQAAGTANRVRRSHAEMLHLGLSANAWAGLKAGRLLVSTTFPPA